MVVGAYPIAKLAALLIKQISKPIANMCKERAKSHPFFRTYVCMPPAQFYNWCEVKAKMWVLNLGKPVNIPVLSQEMAIELGANLLGETVIFVIGASLLVFEYNRQSKKEAAKEEKREQEMNHITTTIADLYFTVQQQQTQLREMERLIHSISGKKLTTPPPKIKPPTETPTSPAPPQPQNPVTPQPQKIHYIVTDYEPHSASTPYPNNGIILQSLNYIQMDVFSSIFSSDTSKDVRESDEQLINKGESFKSIRNKNNIEVAYSRLTKVNKSFVGQSIKFYNKIPEDVTSLTEKKFKTHIKKCLCSKGYYKIRDYVNDKDVWTGIYTPAPNYL